MTILSIVQSCARRLQLVSPSVVITSTDNNIILLLEMVNQAIDDIGNEFLWPELIREYSFTLATSTASYALPADYDRRINETLWNQTQHWPLIGPVTPQLWQQYKSGLITTLPRQRFRVKGWSLTQFYIDPTPSSDENGQTCVYEYISATKRRPKTWAASTSWAGIQYCSYNGYIFNRGSTGAATTGTSAPTPSSLNDGSITWTLVTAEYVFTNDTDEVILNNTMIIDEACWMFLRERGFDYQAQKADAEKNKEVMKTKLEGSSTVSFNRDGSLPWAIGWWSYPEGNYGI